MFKMVQHIYSKQIHDTQRHDTYREEIILNVFYKNTIVITYIQSNVI